MFGTVARIKTKPGAGQELQQVLNQWVEERGPSSGQVGHYLFKLDDRPDEYIMVPLFKDRDAYYRNAEDPGTDKHFQKLRKLLVSDPEWNDGEVIDQKVLATSQAR